jgi:preprotein translocase subunit SecE
MNAPTKFVNTILWLIVIGLLIGSLWMNYAYSSVDISVRLISWLVVAGIILGVASRTTQGINAWVFANEARIELRKVVWPTRHETLQTTLMVVVLIIVIALIIWGMDTLFLYLIGWLTGQRG